MRKIYCFVLTLFLFSACSQQDTPEVAKNGASESFSVKNSKSVTSDEKLLENKKEKISERTNENVGLTSKPYCSSSGFTSPVRKHEQLCKLMICNDNSDFVLDADVLLPDLQFEDFIFKILSTQKYLVSKVTLDCSAVFNASISSNFVFSVKTEDQPARVTRSMSKARNAMKYVGDGVLSNLTINALHYPNTMIGDVQFSRLAKIR